MLSLNVDCLNLICDQLDVCSHISLFSTCTTLRTVIEDYYYNHALTIDDKFWKYSKTHQQKVAQFLACISPHLKEIHVENAADEDLQLLEKSLLRKITTLNVEEFFDDGKIADALKECCHNLRAFSVKYIWLGYSKPFPFPHIQFPNLIKLELKSYNLNELNADNFPKLTDLTLKDCISKNVNFSMLPNLKKLQLEKFTLFSGSTFFNDILKCQALEELEVNFCTEIIPFDDLLKLKKLRKIKFGLEIKKSIPSICKEKEIKWKTLVLANVKQLKMFEKKPEKLLDVHTLQLDFWDFGTNFNKLEKELKKLLSKCKTLQIVKAHPNFWDMKNQYLLDIISSSFDGREEPLYLHTYRSSKKVLFYPSFVRPVLKKSCCSLNDIPDNYILCEWTKNEFNGN